MNLLHWHQRDSVKNGLIVCLAFLLSGCLMLSPDLSPPDVQRVAVLTESQQKVIQLAQRADSFDNREAGIATAVLLGAACALSDCNGAEMIWATAIATDVGASRSSAVVDHNRDAGFRPTAQTLKKDISFARKVADRGTSQLGAVQNAVAEINVLTTQMRLALSQGTAASDLGGWTRQISNITAATQSLADWHEHRLGGLQKSAQIHASAGFDTAEFELTITRIVQQSSVLTMSSRALKQSLSSLPRNVRAAMSSRPIVKLQSVPD